MTEEELKKIKLEYPPFSGKSALNAKDLTGQMFGRLKALYRTENRIAKGGRKISRWVCECQCDKHTILVKDGHALTSGHTTGCGCTKGNRTKEIPAGTMFGYWKVLNRAKNRQDNRVYYTCLCTKCGKTIKEVEKAHLINGESTQCLECSQKKAGEKNVKDETGKIYGYLKVTRRVPIEERPRQDRTGVYWYCDCLNCGKKDVIIFGDYLRNGDTISCGCLKSSKNELYIKQVLENNNLNFKTQITFNDLISPDTNYILRYDFGVYDKNNKLLYIIEYDGEQHFKPASWNNNMVESLEYQQKKDKIKNQYCFEHNIPLIRIPYNKKYTDEDLILSSTKFLLTPENEEKYYNI